MLPDSDKYVISTRFGTPSIDEQLRLIKDSDVKEVVLIDDVLFSGGTLLNIIEKLNYIDLNVKFVCVGICVFFKTRYQ